MKQSKKYPAYMGILSNDKTPHLTIPSAVTLMIEKDATASLIKPMLALDLGAIWPSSTGKAVFFHAQSEGNWAESLTFQIEPDGRYALISCSLSELELPDHELQCDAGYVRIVETDARDVHGRRFNCAVKLGGSPDWAQSGWEDAFREEHFVGELKTFFFGGPNYYVYLFIDHEKQLAHQITQST
jgi:hypothetical protein